MLVLRLLFWLTWKNVHRSLVRWWRWWIAQFTWLLLIGCLGGWDLRIWSLSIRTIMIVAWCRIWIT